MTDKERMEELKEEVKLLRDDMCVTSIEVDTSADTILDDMEWLIEQVELSEELKELEQEYIELNNDFTELALENKRYHKALTFLNRMAADDVKMESSTDPYLVVDVTSDALEREEE